MTPLKEGDKAPLFTATDQDGNKIALKDLKGKKIVLYFYPEDMTPTCTVQACNLRDNFALLKKNGYTIIGVSPDTAVKHKKFQAAHQLPFTLIPDTDHAVINLYGVWGEKSMYGRTYMGLIRTTFVIDEKGVISKVISKPKSKKHAEEILE